MHAVNLRNMLNAKTRTSRQGMFFFRFLMLEKNIINLGHIFKEISRMRLFC